MTLVNMVLLLGEVELEKRIREKPQSEIPIAIPEGFDTEIAWELLNLTRVAYRDYEIFNTKHSGKERPPSSTDPSEAERQTNEAWNSPNLEKGSKLYVAKQPSPKSQPNYVDRYFICAPDDSAVPEGLQGQPYCEYEVLATYTSLAYAVLGAIFKKWPALPPLPDVDRFGFIAKRKDGDAEVLFVVFRGTREPEEWVSNFQFQQVPFLMDCSDTKEPEKVSLGFNKIYTGYRPGLFLGFEPLNAVEKFFSQYLSGILKLLNQADRAVAGLLRAIGDRVHHKIRALHDEPMQATIERELAKYKDKDIPVYFTGHSLGGALATISALHVAKDVFKQDESSPKRVSLYTFASPRTGDVRFATTCHKLLSAYRIANSGDLVPVVPPTTFKLAGVDVLGKHLSLAKIFISIFRFFLGVITGGITRADYEHVGSNTCFTTQVKSISANHNLNVTYARALPPLPNDGGSVALPPAAASRVELSSAAEEILVTEPAVKQNAN